MGVFILQNSQNIASEHNSSYDTHIITHMHDPIQKSGAIILSPTHPTQICLLYRANKNDISFPKGHLEPGESAEQGAQREIKEETGLEIEITQKLPILSYEHPKDGPVELHLFLAQATTETFSPEDATDQPFWCDLSNVAEQLTYDHQRDYWLAIEPIVKEATTQH